MNVVTFHEIGIRNFLSYGNNFTVVPLNFTDPTLIIGRNYDSTVDGQTDSNGAGKTTILTALCYALFDQTIQDANKDKLINFINKKNLEVWVTFQVNNTFYKVIRFRKNSARGGDGVLIYEREGEGEFLPDHEKAPDSVANANAYIARCIGLPFDVFSRAVVFSARQEPFLSLPTTSTTKTNQSDVLEELCGFTEISQKADILKAQMKDSKDELETLIERNDRIEAERGRHAVQLENAQRRVLEWEANHKINISTAEQNLQILLEMDFQEQHDLLTKSLTLSEVIRSLETDLKGLRSNVALLQGTSGRMAKWEVEHAEYIKSLQTKIDSNGGVDFAEERETLSLLEQLKEQISSTLLEKNKHTTTIQIATKDLLTKETEIGHLRENKCPYCSQRLENTMLKLDELELITVELKSTIILTEKALSKATKSYDKMIKQRDQVVAMLKYKTLTELTKAETQYNIAVSQLEEARKEENPYSDASDIEETIAARGLEIVKLQTDLQDTKVILAEVQSKLKYSDHRSLSAEQAKVGLAEANLKRLTTEINPHTANYDELKVIKLDDPLNGEIDSLKNLVEHQTFLHKLLTKKDSFIRKALLQKSLPYLNTRLRMYLDKVGLPHKVEFTENMTANISQFGREVDFNTISSGQQARVNLALSFAFRDLLQARHSRLNLCILDECLDVGLSTVGVTHAAKMVKDIAKQDKLAMFVVSHKDEIASMFDKKLEVELRNGFSSIVGLEAEELVEE